MRVTSLGSGSTGNAYLIEAGPQGRTRLLIDAGFSMRVLRDRLSQAGCKPRDLTAVLITHEHSDHILGLPPLLKYYGVPVYADQRTLTELRAIIARGEMRSETGRLVRLELEASSSTLSEAGVVIQAEQITLEAEINDQVVSAVEDVAEEGTGPLADPAEVSASAKAADVAAGDVPRKLPAVLALEQLWCTLPQGMSRVIGDIEVRSFPVSHDAVAPCGYLLSAGGCRVCIVTDTGKVTPVMLEALAQADLLILEANYDHARLLNGPYPYSLKQRILSSTGHLSNAQSAEAVLHTWRSDAVRWLWLAHLSRTNNTPQIALTSMQESLRWAGANLAQLHLTALSHEMGGTWDSSRLWIDDNLWKMP